MLPKALPVAAGFYWLKANARRQYLRARLEQGPTGLQVVPHQKQGSAMLTSACWADGLAVVEAGRILKAGELVDFLPFSELAV